ncbi:tyrosine-protein kinase domain-containing protein [Geodermatophilus marinus]|uniref:polysaccharide biosynthesis tyrosine autokinase n=1 Tax=Geodermatophilus sp. LHW52908 TaxID=2303986 RepID=UPI000E3CB89F|nr:polysaccharide biosynthesis tyrosine autokinase [Geodermatophilus sp. LHW52908]RFU22797.1 polysaccharide biosynthesis tyrosine autokinase [Geodermatophilus sp. LHW52908]
MAGLSAATADQLVRLGGAAALGVLAVVLLRRSPQLGVGGWLAVVCLVPVWAGVGLGAYFEPQVLAGLAAVGALVLVRRCVPLSPVGADLLIAAFALSALLPALVGRGTANGVFVLLAHWASAYLLGRLAGHRLPLGRVYALVAVAFTAVAVLALVEWVAGWNPFHLVPGSGGLREVWATIQERGGVARAEGAFGHSIALGGSLALALPLTLAAPLRPAVRLGMAVLMGAACAVTFSRIGLGTAVLGVLLSIAFLRTGLPGRLRLLICGGLLVGAAAAAPLVTQVFAAAGDEASGSAGYRADLLSLLGEARLLGLSPSYWRSPTGEASFGTFRSIDSALVLTTLTYGWIPLAFLGAAVLSAVVVVVRGQATAPTVALVAQLPAFATVALITQYASLVWFVAGLAVAAQALAPRGERAADPPGPGDATARDPHRPHSLWGTQPNPRRSMATVVAVGDRSGHRPGGDGIVGVAGYLQVLRRRMWGVVVCVALAGGAALSASLLATPTYTSTAGLFFSLQNGNTASDLAQGATFTRAQMASYATLTTTPAVLDPVIDRLDLETTAGGLAGRVSATAPNDTVLLQVSASATSPTEAARIADAVAGRLAEVVEEVAPADTEGRATVLVTPVAPAQVPTGPSSPDTTLNLLVGLVAGAALGVLYAMLRESLDTRVRDAVRVRALTDAPVLGLIAARTQRAGEELVLATDPRSAQAELFRQLRTNLDFLRLDGEPLSLAVTSSLPGEGKSTVALDLALALAEVHERVLLVDADMRRPAVAHRLDLEGSAGLSTVLVGRAAVDDVVQEWGPHGLHVLTAGAVPPNPAQLLDSPRMTALMAELATRYDAVVVDSPPVLPVTDALLLSRCTGGTLVVVDTHRVRRNQLAEALRQLGNVDTRPLGVVLNRLVREKQVYGYGAYGSDQGDDVDAGRWWRKGARPAAVGRQHAVETHDAVPAGQRAPAAAGRPRP